MAKLVIEKNDRLMTTIDDNQFTIKVVKRM